MAKIATDRKQRFRQLCTAAGKELNVKPTSEAALHLGTLRMAREQFSERLLAGQMIDASALLKLDEVLSQYMPAPKQQVISFQYVEPVGKCPVCKATFHEGEYEPRRERSSVPRTINATATETDASAPSAPPALPAPAPPEPVQRAPQKPVPVPRSAIGSSFLAVPLEVLGIEGRQLVSVDMSPSGYDTAPTWRDSDGTPLPVNATVLVALSRS